MTYSIEGSRTNDAVSGGFVDLAAVVVLEFLLGHQHALDLVELELVVVRLGRGNLQLLHVGGHVVDWPVCWSLEEGLGHEAGLVHLTSPALARFLFAEEGVTLVSGLVFTLLSHLHI